MTSNEERFTPNAWAELTKRWERDEITLEQLAGQLLIWSQQLHEMLVVCQREQAGTINVLVEVDARLMRVEGQIAQP